MLALHGTGVSDGITIGKAYVLQRDLPEIPEYTVASHQTDAEIERLNQAVVAARRQLRAIRDHIPANAPAEAASFLDAHLLILDDKMLVPSATDTIQRERRNAEWALRVQSERLSEIFEKMDDAYLRNKRVDVNQVVERILRNLLMPGFDEHEKMSPGEIVVATDLTPRTRSYSSTTACAPSSPASAARFRIRRFSPAVSAFRRSSRCTTPRATCARARN